MTTPATSRKPVSFQELESLNPDQRIWFARRCSLRLFPFIGSRGSLTHWGNAGEVYLEGMELSLLDTRTDSDTRAAYASASYAAAYANDEDAIAYAVSNAITAYDNAFVDVVEYGAAAAYSSAVVSLAIAAAISVQQDEMKNQREDLERLIRKERVPGPSPLWNGVQPKSVSGICHAFQNACLSLGRGDIYERYRVLLHSMEPDRYETRKRADDWLLRWRRFEASGA